MYDMTVSWYELNLARFAVSTVDMETPERMRGAVDGKQAAQVVPWWLKNQHGFCGHAVHL